MECSTRQSGETICKNSEKGIEREFKGFEQCKLTGSPKYGGHLHDGSIEKCLEFTFDKTPIVCPGDEENCSVIILSKETRGKYRNLWTSKHAILDWKTSKEYEKKMKEANNKKKEFLNKNYKGNEVAVAAYDKAVGEGKKELEIDKAVKEAVVAEKKKIAEKEREECLKQQYKYDNKYPSIYEIAAAAYDKTVGEGKKELEIDKAVKEAVVAEEKKIAEREREEYLEQYKNDKYPSIYKVAAVAYDKAVGEGKKGTGNR
jgi:hypothetical protein